MIHPPHEENELDFALNDYREQLDYIKENEDNVAISK